MIDEFNLPGSFCIDVAIVSVPKNINVVLNGKKHNTKRRKFGAAIGDNVQTGINATINVGTIIGNNCFIGQSSSVKGEITPSSKIL